MQIKICKSVDVGFHLEKEADRRKDIKMTKIDDGEVISHLCVYDMKDSEMFEVYQYRF